MISEERERDFNEIATIKTIKKKSAKMYQSEKGETNGKSVERAGEEKGEGARGLCCSRPLTDYTACCCFVCLFVLLIYRPFLQSHSVSEPIIISSREYASPDPPPSLLYPYNTAGINKQ